MKYILAFIFFFLILSHPNIIAQQTLLGTIQHDGGTRDYRLRLPPQYSPNGQALPLVFNLHGYGSNAFEQELYTNFVPLADAEGFIVCHPDGLNNAWNVGFGGTTADDVDFLDKLIDSLSANYNIDLSRVYSTGMSNGGYMSYKLACELTHRIAAIASVTGSMVPSELTICSPSRAIPVMQIHGTADAVVAYNGSNISTPIESLVEWWSNINGCMDGPFVTDVPDINTDDGCTAELYEYTSCDENVKVEFYKITGGEHTWPDALLDIGVTNRDFNGSSTIWEFFKQYSLPASVPVKEIISDIEVNISPNPFQDEINISIDDNHLQEIFIYDVLGQNVFYQKLENNISSFQFSTQHFEKGTYFIKIKTENHFTTKKLIKQ